jgi:DNA repair exonuclease SbcCD nuclease subunit
MKVRLIHTADLQIGRAFRSMPADLAGELAAARLDAIGRIAKIARDKGAGHVLVAGDVFDDDKLETVAVRRALERMAQDGGVQWLLLPGNHDPARAGGLWERIVARVGLPANVAALVKPEPFVLDRETVVLPAPLTSKNPGRDPTAWFDDAVVPSGATRIGLAHGSVQGFDSEGESAVMIAPDRAKSAGLSYLALGDWHGAKAINERSWYSGTPEPDRFPDNDPGYVLAVTLEGGAVPVVEKIKSAAFTWTKAAATIYAPEDLRPLEQAILRYSDAPARLLLRLTLDGGLSLAAHAALAVWREVWAGKVRHLEIDDRNLAALPEQGDIERLGGEGPLADAARSLDAMHRDTAHPESAAAGLALVRLFAFAEHEREGAS